MVKVRHMRGSEQAEEKERERLLPWKHQADFHILNGNHGNNYTADRQAVFWKARWRERESEIENAGEGKRREK